VTLERFLLSRDCLLDLRGQVALVGATRRQLRPPLERKVPAEPQHPRVLGCSLAVRSERRRPLGCRRREAQHRLSVGGRLGVVCKSGEILRSARRGRERREDLSVERQSPVRRKRLFHGQTRKLVPERHRCTVGGQHS
jgi:hypothetical protein